MNLRQMTGWNKSPAVVNEVPTADDTGACLTALIEGTAEAMPRIDAKTYAEFHSTATRMAAQIPDRMSPAEKLKAVGTVLHEFEVYRTGVDEALRANYRNWRALTTTLVHELLAAMGLNATSPSVLPLIEGISTLTTTEEIRAYRELLSGFLELRKKSSEAEKSSPLIVADCSNANDNAAGLMGGGAAVEHLRKVIESGRTGFVVIFKLSCLDMVNQRFGPEAVADCQMAVSAFLTENLESTDAIFHWNDSSLVAILLNRPNEHLLNAELHRVVQKNGDISVNIGGRTTMLRIPISFELTPIHKFKTANDLYKLSLQSAKKG